MAALTPAQDRALRIIRQHRSLILGGSYQFGIRMATVRKLAELGLVNLVEGQFDLAYVTPTETRADLQS